MKHPIYRNHGQPWTSLESDKLIAENGRYECKAEVAHLADNVVKVLIDKFAINGFHVTLNKGNVMVISWRDI